MHFRLSIVFAVAVLPCLAETNLVTSVRQPAEKQRTEASRMIQQEQNAPAQRAEQMRMSCIEGRRYICGRVTQIQPDGMVVDSGYPELMKPPFNQSWVVRANVSLKKNPSVVEEKKP